MKPHTEQPALSVSRGKDIAQSTSPSTAVRVCSQHAGVCYSLTVCKSPADAHCQALLTFRYFTSSPGTSLAPACTSWQYWKNLCKCMSWKRQRSSVQHPQCLSTPALQLALKPPLTFLRQRCPQQAPWPCQWPHWSPIPSPRTTVLLPAFANVPSPCPSPGSQIISRLSTKLPAVLKFSCGCATLSPDPHPTLAWVSGSLPLPAVALYLPHQPNAHLRHFPSHCSPSSSMGKFNCWVI